MVSKKDKLKFLDDFYNQEKERIYYSINVVNIKKAQSREEELFQSNEYLPNLLRGFLSINYYSIMEENGVLDKVMLKMRDTRKQGREADVIEYINWIDSHKQFQDLLNEKKVKDLGDLLEELEKEYTEMKKLI